MKHRRSWPAFLGLALALSLATPGGTSGAQSGAGGNSERTSGTARLTTTVRGRAPIHTTVVADLTFQEPTETQQFFVTPDRDGTLRIDTKDCCIRGDHWLVAVINQKGGETVGAIDPVVAACSDGSTTDYSGEADLSLPHPRPVKLIVAYCSGVDDFGAGMKVRFRFAGNLTVETA